MVKQKMMLFYLALFPFGQLVGFLLQQFLDLPFRLHITDVIALLLSGYLAINILRNKLSLSQWERKGITFALYGLIVALIAPIFIDIHYSVESFLYSIRLLSYLLFAMYVSRGSLSNELLTKSLILVSIVVCAVGWIQYLLIPDLTSMKLFGWDDHYYRLVGTFFDPAFLGMILVLGILLAIWKKRYLVSLFMIITLAFTYSRASWLALIIGLIYFFYKNYSRKVVSLLALILLLLIPILPNPGGEGVNLRRTNSIEQKLDNFSKSVEIVKLSPVFGVGNNNICVIKNMLSFENENNSCTGLDNSLLFILATSGIVGAILFTDLLDEILRNTNARYKLILYSSMLAVGFHGLFTLTWFYPWVLGWLGILIGISRKKLRGVGHSE